MTIRGDRKGRGVVTERLLFCVWPLSLPLLSPLSRLPSLPSTLSLSPLLSPLSHQELIDEAPEEKEHRRDEILRRFAFHQFTQHKFEESLHCGCLQHPSSVHVVCCLQAVVVDLEKKKFVRKVQWSAIQSSLLYSICQQLPSRLQIGDETSILPSKLFQYLEHSLVSTPHLF